MDNILINLDNRLLEPLPVELTEGRRESRLRCSKSPLSRVDELACLEYLIFIIAVV